MAPDFSNYNLEWVARTPAVARLLPRPRPDAALRVHEDGAADPAVVPAARAVGAEVAAAPRADRPAAHDVPRRDDRGHPPRPGRGRAVDDHDAHLRRAHRLPHDPSPSGTATTGPTASVACSTRRCATGTCCPPTAPSTCSSTSTWPTRSARSSASTTRAGIELTDEARAEIEAYRAAHPRGKDGRVVYDLRRDFATTPEEVRARFGAYLDRFPVRIEVT